jgi:endonuclease III
MHMATQSKTQLLTNVHTLLKRRYKPKADRDGSRLSVLRAVVYGICHEDTTREQANQAVSRFKDGFFDWNEIRVSSVDEIQESLAGIPDPEERAQRIRRFLRQLFNRTYSFTLDALTKKPLKEALKVLHTYDAFASDYVTATVIQQALGGHAIPIDKATHRVLERLGISEPDVHALRSILERAVPKNRGGEFLDLIEELANDTCLETEPECPRCELRKVCAFAQKKKQEAHSSAHTGRGGTARVPKDVLKTSKGKGPEAIAPSPATKSTPPKTSREATHPSKTARGKPRGAK